MAVKDDGTPVIEQQLDTDNPYIANDIFRRQKNSK